MTEALRDWLADHGRIVTIGSIAARNGGGGSYGAEKAAVEAWTADIARAHGPRGITANVVAPGLVAKVVAFLASRGAGHVTGQVIPVNGGAQLGRQTRACCGVLDAKGVRGG